MKMLHDPNSRETLSGYYAYADGRDVGDSAAQASACAAGNLSARHRLVGARL
jgi:hypothetical protein